MESRSSHRELKVCRCSICGPLGGVHLTPSLVASHARQDKHRARVRAAEELVSASVATLTQPEPLSRSDIILRDLDTLIQIRGQYDLQFIGDPLSYGPYVFSTIRQSNGRLDSPYALTPGHTRNRVHLQIENHLRLVTAEVASWPPSPEKQEIEEAVTAVYGMMEVQRALAWQAQRDAENHNIIHTGMFYLPPVYKDVILTSLS